jgi:hypothetical protein
MDSPRSIRVLGISEVLQRVTKQLSPSSLAAFAQVSPLVSEQCLDALWKHLPTAFPLLAVLPSVVLISGQYVSIHCSLSQIYLRFVTVDPGSTATHPTN